MYSKQLWGEGQKRLARRRGNNETSARASSEALEVETATRRVLGVELGIQHNAIHGAFAHRAHVLGHAPAAETIRTRDVRATRNSSRRLHRPKADRALVDTCVEIKFRAPHAVDAT